MSLPGPEPRIFDSPGDRPLSKGHADYVGHRVQCEAPRKFLDFHFQKHWKMNIHIVEKQIKIKLMKYNLLFSNFFENFRVFIYSKTL
uniref:Uncharacterized protein n=1 Tax=Romanomermis culicivorax TaxID=13658 RepID=A0A915IS14_ROMCU